MDRLPSAIILVRDGQAIRANRHATFLFGWKNGLPDNPDWVAVSYTHLRAHET